MKELLQQRFFDNSVQSYLYVIGAILLVLLLRRLLTRRIATFIYHSITRIGTTVQKKHFLNLVVQPLDLLVVFLVAVAAVEKLIYPKAWKIQLYKMPLQKLIEATSTAVLILTFFWVVLRIIDFVAMVLEEKANATPDMNDNQLVVFFKDFFKVVISIIAVLLVLRFSFNQSIGNLLTGLSIVGAAIALATRESLENLIASFIIFFDKPFTTGNTIKVEGFTGTVERIGLRSTRVRTDQKTYISVPNKKMVDSILDNLTMRTQRRVDIKLELSLSTTAAKLKDLIEGIKQVLQKDVVEDFNAYVSDTGQQAHIVQVEYFTNAFQEVKAYLALREQINLEIIQLQENLQVEPAAKNMDVVVHAAS